MHGLTKNDDDWSNSEYLAGHTFSSRSKMLPLHKDLGSRERRATFEDKDEHLN